MPTQVLITGALHEQAIAGFRANPDFRVNYRPDCSREELLRHLAEAQVLVTRSETDVDAEVIDKAPQLKVIARAAVGVGNIDIELATKKGILVLNCPAKNTNSAAELTMGLLLSMMRRLPQAHATMKAGGWDRHTFTGNELRGRRLGIVGLGNVGHRVAKFARGFDMEVFAYDPYIAPQVFARNDAKQCESLLDMAKQVDVLSVHVPLNKETKHMVDERILSAMPDGSFVVNAARGGVITEEALLKALNSGKIAGAGIDTWESEPKVHPGLLAHPRVWCSPHIGASTVEAQLAIGETVLRQVEKAVEGGVVDHPVNLPKIGVIDNPVIKAYAVLAEKLGSLLGQILDFNPTGFSLSYRGDLANLDHGIVRLSLMKGYASQVANDFISFVNAEQEFTRMGLAIEERRDPSFQSYRSALKVRISGDDGRQLTVGGVVFDERYIRISLLNDFYFEVEPAGELILVENEDQPGVIGDVGHFLAARSINIDSFNLSRNRKGGRAMAIIKVDNPVAPALVRELAAIKNVVKVHAVAL